MGEGQFLLKMGFESQTMDLPEIIPIHPGHT